MRGKVRDVTVIQTYAPTSNATEEERELFYRQLQTHVNKYRKDVVVIVGDFNAKDGKRTNENEKRAIGNFALVERNDNREELVNFAIENELSIMNTMFRPATHTDFINVYRYLSLRIRQNTDFPP